MTATPYGRLGRATFQSAVATSITPQPSEPQIVPTIPLAPMMRDESLQLRLKHLHITQANNPWMLVALILQRLLQGGTPGATQRWAARRFSWERLARWLRSCTSSSQRNSSAGPNRSLGSTSRTNRYTCGRVIWGRFSPPVLLQAQQERSSQQAQGDMVMPSGPTSLFSVSNSVSMGHRDPPTRARVSREVSSGALEK
jgi:hypothetical protein